MTPEPEALKACPHNMLMIGDDQDFVCMSCRKHLFMSAEDRKMDDDDLTAVYMAGFYRGKDAGRVEGWKAGKGDIGIPVSEQVQALTAERDALKAQIERMTSDAAVEAAAREVFAKENFPEADPEQLMPFIAPGDALERKPAWLEYSPHAKAALAAALRAARGEG